MFSAKVASDKESTKKTSRWSCSDLPSFWPNTVCLSWLITIPKHPQSTVSTYMKVVRKGKWHSCPEYFLFSSSTMKQFLNKRQKENNTLKACPSSEIWHISASLEWWEDWGNQIQFFSEKYPLQDSVFHQYIDMGKVTQTDLRSGWSSKHSYLNIPVCVNRMFCSYYKYVL